MHTLEESVERNEALEFESLLGEWSNRCLEVTADQIDRTIDRCQHSVCERLGFDRSELWQACSEAEDSLMLTHLCERSDEAAESFRRGATLPAEDNRYSQREEIPFRTAGKAFFPWIFDRVRRGEVVAISTLEDLPKEASCDREMLARQGTKSIAVVPMAIGAKWIGFVTFATALEFRGWSESQVRRLRLVGDIFANALARGRTDQAFRQCDLRLRVLADGAQAGMLEIDMASGEICATGKARELLDLAPDEPLNCEKWLDRMHPEDRLKIRQNLEHTDGITGEVLLDHRVVRPQGSRWMRSRISLRGAAPGGGARLAVVLTDLTDRKEIEETLDKSVAEVKALKERLKAETEYLKEEVKLNRAHAKVVGRSRGIRRVLQQVEQVATVNSPVLITGESGTGKELIAQSIHRLSPRGNHSMVIVNCAALPAGLIESELFGREKGAFTGALGSQAGRFEMADQSTIFLDEVAELPLELQGKLLRVLQEGEYARLGNPRTRKVDVRVIAATNRELSEEVRKQRFREDLYYRLSVFPIHLPPLRERLEDIPLLVFAFLEELSSRMGKKITKVPCRVMEMLERHYWPGNIRELRNVIERGIIISSGDTLRVSLSNNPHPSRQQAVTLAEVERQHILATLEKSDWHIKGPHGAAKILDLKPGTLYSRMRKLGIPHRRQKDGMAT
jgi:transcriptional regulator with GAF, ATPase, and Fis domain